jgi:flagellar biosynthesis protein FlhB
MAQGEDDGAEKVFDPTPQKLAEARRKGDVAKSNDVGAAAAYIGLLAVLFLGGAHLLDRGASALMIFIAQPDRLTGMILGPGGQGLSAGIIGEVALALAPVLLVPMALVIAGLVGQQAVVFSGDKLKPKLSKVSILKNAKQKFGPTGLMEFAKAAVKLIAIATALMIYLTGDLDRMIGAVTAEPRVVGGLMGESLIVLLSLTCVIAVTIAGADLVWQRFDHRRKLRMSHQEIREETKQSEGDPYMKAERRQRGREIATNRMLLDVPKADVVIVNPTHYAVALQWARTRGSAPVCVAKGQDDVALRIREIAAEAKVPIHSDPPTARALHAAVEIGHEIRPEHYRAVAAAIRFADRMRKAARARGRPGET